MADYRIIPFDFTQWNRTDAKIQQYLENRYPDGIAYAISKPVYKRIHRRAVAHEMPVEEYLQVLGFAYKKERSWEYYHHYRNVDELCAAIREEYGDQTIAYIHRKPFYPNVLHFAQLAKQSVWEFLESNGFRYDDRYNIGADWEEQTLIEELERAFPDRVIDKTGHLWFSRPLKKAARRNGLELESYLRHLGFRFAVIKDDEIEVNEFRLKLMTAYPDGIVKNISKQPWYDQLRLLCERLGTSVPLFVTHWGYEYEHSFVQPKRTMTEDDLHRAILDWVKDNAEKPIESWPMYPEIKKHAWSKNLSATRYIKMVISNSGMKIALPGRGRKASKR